MNAYSTLVQCTVRLVKLTRVGIKAGFFNSYYFCYFKFLKTSWSKVRSPQESKKKKHWKFISCVRQGPIG